MSEAELTAHILSTLANLLLAGAAIAASVAAFLGLNTWRKQLSWQADHELSRKTLILLYRLRDATFSLRHPAIWSSESDAAMEGIERPRREEEIRFLETTRVYEKRWEKITEVRSELYPLFLEGDAVWGVAYRDLRRPLLDLEIELRLVIQNYLRAIDPNRSEATRGAASKLLRKKRDIMYDTLDESDEFKRDYSCAFEPLEITLREKLGRAL